MCVLPNVNKGTVKGLFRHLCVYTRPAQLINRAYSREVYSVYIWPTCVALCENQVCNTHTHTHSLTHKHRVKDSEAIIIVHPLRFH